MLAANSRARSLYQVDVIWIKKLDFSMVEYECDVLSLGRDKGVVMFLAMGEDGGATTFVRVD